jgi:hypothetical protein
VTCTVNCGTLYVQSIEFTIGGLQSSCRWMMVGRHCKYELVLNWLAKLNKGYIKKWKKVINGKDVPELNFKAHIKGSEYLCK